MPIARLTLNNALWGKLQTHSGKKDNVDVKQMITEHRITRTGTSGYVIWEPTPAFVKRFLDIVNRELEWVRKKGSTSHLEMMELKGTLEGMIKLAEAGLVTTTEGAEAQ